jgi:hypothetical protein
MKGLRLAIGVVVMGVAVPAVLFFLLKLTSLWQFFTIAAVCFVAWGVADLTANILDRPRLEDRTPGSALRDWEKTKTGATDGE